MVEDRVTVRSPIGLHARPAAVFVQTSLKHQCRITVECSGKKADAKSILQILALGVKCGQEITIRAEGPGEVEAVSSLVNLINAV